MDFLQCHGFQGDLNRGFHRGRIDHEHGFRLRFRHIQRHGLDVFGGQRFFGSKVCQRNDFFLRGLIVQVGQLDFRCGGVCIQRCFNEADAFWRHVLAQGGEELGGQGGLDRFFLEEGCSLGQVGWLQGRGLQGERHFLRDFGQGQGFFRLQAFQADFLLHRESVVGFRAAEVQGVADRQCFDGLFGRFRQGRRGGCGGCALLLRRICAGFGREYGGFQMGHRCRFKGFDFSQAGFFGCDGQRLFGFQGEFDQRFARNMHRVGQGFALIQQVDFDVVCVQPLGFLGGRCRGRDIQGRAEVGHGGCRFKLKIQFQIYIATQHVERRCNLGCRHGTAVFVLQGKLGMACRGGRRRVLAQIQLQIEYLGIGDMGGVRQAGEAETVVELGWCLLGVGGLGRSLVRLGRIAAQKGEVGGQHGGGGARKSFFFELGVRDGQRVQIQRGHLSGGQAVQFQGGGGVGFDQLGAQIGEAEIRETQAVQACCGQGRRCGRFDHRGRSHGGRRGGRCRSGGRSRGCFAAQGSGFGQQGADFPLQTLACMQLVNPGRELGVGVLQQGQQGCVGRLFLAQPVVEGLFQPPCCIAKVLESDHAATALEGVVTAPDGGEGVLVGGGLVQQVQVGADGFPDFERFFDEDFEQFGVDLRIASAARLRCCNGGRRRCLDDRGGRRRGCGNRGRHPEVQGRDVQFQGLGRRRGQLVQGGQFRGVTVGLTQEVCVQNGGRMAGLDVLDILVVRRGGADAIQEAQIGQGRCVLGRCHRSGDRHGDGFDFRFGLGRVFFRVQDAIQIGMAVLEGFHIHTQGR